MTTIALSTTAEDLAALAGEYDEQQVVLVAEHQADEMKDITRGRYAYGMGQPLNTMWSYYKRAGWLAAQTEHDTTPDDDES